MNTEITGNFGINQSVALMQGAAMLLWVVLIVWAILRILKRTRGIESVLWALFIVFVPVVGLVVSLLHFRGNSASAA